MRSPQPKVAGGGGRLALALLAGLIVALLAGAAPALAAEDVFLDVKLGHYYYEPIQGLGEAGVIDGYPAEGGKEYRPDNRLWRAQFAKMILGVLQVPVNEDDWQDSAPPFTDLGPDLPDVLYPHEYVAKAAALGITNGVTATNFAPYNDITRAQLVTMVVRAAYALKPGAMVDLPVGYTGTLTGFASPDHTLNMRAAEHNGLLTHLQGFGPSWNPWAPATRAEAAQIMWNLYHTQPKPQPPVLFDDDFSNPASGWPSSTQANSTLGYVEGHYEITLLKPSILSWGLRDVLLGNGTVDVDATPTTATVPVEYGLIFRAVDGSNFYQLSVTSAGKVRLWRQKAGVWEPVSPDMSTDAVRKGAAKNHLRVTFIGDKLTVAVNHVILGSYTDATFTAGSIGLYAGSLGASGATVSFDDFVVSSPPTG